MPPLERVDRTAFEVVPLEEADARDKSYWLACSPEERLQAMELMRQIIYNYDPTERLQRVFEVAELETD
ncbi:MAG: hypothetical protein NZM28_07600 [Fimbriimonadales bacterium]|nr:hypothetical protein [Fimbriimonadales bacterium]